MDEDYNPMKFIIPSTRVRKEGVAQTIFSYVIQAKLPALDRGDRYLGYIKPPSTGPISPSFLPQRVPVPSTKPQPHAYPHTLLMISSHRSALVTPSVCEQDIT